MALGYLDAARTSERFVAMPSDDRQPNRWYRTGDIAYLDDNGELIHCGRNDQQIKLRGYRIELGEIEHVLRNASGTDFVAVLPYPTDAEGMPTALTAVLARNTAGEESIREEARRRLPDYMVPGTLVFVDELPMNANGKIDRRRLLDDLKRADV